MAIVPWSLQPSMLPTGYRGVDTCANCKHCWIGDDPEAWDGYCNFPRDVEQFPYNFRDIPPDQWMNSCEENRGFEWEFCRRVSPSCICDYYERGKPQRETKDFKG